MTHRLETPSRIDGSVGARGVSTVVDTTRTKDIPMAGVSYVAGSQRGVTVSSRVLFLGTPLSEPTNLELLRDSLSTSFSHALSSKALKGTVAHQPLGH